MGQYYQLCNIDRQQLLHPHSLDDGLKLMEFGMSSMGTLSALAGLLTLDKQQKGPWAGDRIVITGDYADEGRFVPKEFADINLYAYANGYGQEQAADGEGESDDSEDRDEEPPARFKSMTEEAKAQLQGLGLPTQLRTRGFGSREVRAIPALCGKSAVYDQPEDLFDALHLAVVEDLREVIEGITCQLRMANIPSGVAWKQAADAVLELDNATGRAKSLLVRFEDRRDPTVKPFTRALAFPANVVEVRDWLMVSDEQKLLENKQPPLLAA